MKSVVLIDSRKIFVLVVILTVTTVTTLLQPAPGYVHAQQQTPVIPTVTGTPIGPYIIVNADQDQINVRSGPGQLYPKVGVLLAGQQVPAKGRSPGNEWIYIVYPGIQGGMGWVWAPLVSLQGGELPVVEPPPTPTPLYTSTIDPTLAAQFVITLEPSRLPTFTPPGPLIIPTLPTETSSGVGSGIPIGLVIVGIGSLGILLGLISLLRGR